MKNPWNTSGPSRVAFDWRRGLAFSVLWAMTVSALEALAPVSPVDPMRIVSSWLAVLPEWLFSGVVLLVFTLVAATSLSGATFVLAAAAVLGVLTFSYGTIDSLFASQFGRVPGPADMEASVAYLGWLHLLYGGLFVGSITLAQRAERTRALLGRAEIARSRSEALFGQAQIAALQGSVDPVLLLRVLEEMQRRYAIDVAGADRLLDLLVGFLRLAMPGVRSGQSTLGAELAVVRSYTQLGAELDPQRAAWHCDIDAALAEMPFPSLLLLPVLDQLATSLSRTAAITLTATRGASTVRLALHGQAQPGWLTGDLLHRLRVGLHATHGNAASVTLEPTAVGDGAALIMTLPHESPSPRAASALLPISTAGGASSWTSPAITTT